MLQACRPAPTGIRAAVWAARQLSGQQRPRFPSTPPAFLVRPTPPPTIRGMPTASRILKYTPAAVIALLVVAWVFTQGGWMQFVSRKFVVALQHGSVTGYWQSRIETFSLGSSARSVGFVMLQNLDNSRPQTVLARPATRFPFLCYAPLSCPSRSAPSSPSASASGTTSPTRR